MSEQIDIKTLHEKEKIKLIQTIYLGIKALINNSNNIITITYSLNEVTTGNTYSINDTKKQIKYSIFSVLEEQTYFYLLIYTKDSLEPLKIKSADIHIKGIYNELKYEYQNIIAKEKIIEEENKLKKDIEDMKKISNILNKDKIQI